MTLSIEKQAHILIIEDNPAESELLKYAFDQLLEPSKLTLTTLQDGEEALHFIQDKHRRPQQSPPCMIVLDLGLPKYDGIAVLQAIKAEPDLNDIPIVVLTNALSPKTEALLLEASVQIYRTKPSSLEQVLALAAEILALCNAGLSTAPSAETSIN